ncbi:SbcC/MukB-like Walker B domain-containing protein [Actinomadura kijaniata]|uniref:SbcC/MukB-like Walker B domain-containing protein n=1 Tax=Actinomadura kijaniata TaxID=46161 RepID=UPI003F1D022B
MTQDEEPFRWPETATFGEPGVTGRWQPTRAGAVNSWAWADETLWFADGWLALAGPNGSGKSLTASMLITVLLDAETSQKALSVSGKASGTLASRHTDRREQEDRTGAWWLEYGLRDETSGRTEYLTTGMWLRAVGGKLHRAFFLVPARVGRDLALRRENEAVRIDDLAEQLAARRGGLFTSSSKLRPPAAAKLPSVDDEHEFRHAVRTRLFAPLNEIQFDALVSVLRSLRSVRTAEAISPERMRQVLTDALPALEPDQLKVVADTMERISELEKQLDRSRTEADLLATVERRYRSYRNAITQLQAAELAAANTAYDDQTRAARQANESLTAAKRTVREIDERLRETRGEVARLEGEFSAADRALNEHAGAELPLREKLAANLDTAAGEAESRADEAARAADGAGQQASDAADDAQKAQHHLRKLTDDLRLQSGRLGAESATDRLLAAYRDLCGAAPHTAPPALDLETLSGTPSAWAETRVEQIGSVQEALRRHGEAQTTERALAEAHRRAEDDETRAHDAAEAAAESTRQAETAFLEALAAWAGSLHRLQPPPSDLSAPEGNDRYPADQVERWLSAEVNAARDRIDLSGHRQRAATDDAVARSAEQAAANARTAHRRSLGQIATADRELRTAQDQADAEARTDAATLSQTRSAHAQEITAARDMVSAARARRSEAEAQASRAARDWLAGAHRWRASLVHLDARTVPLPDPDDTTVDPTSVRIAAHEAHASAAGTLHQRVSIARDAVDRVAGDITELRAELDRARQAAPVPDAPAWRSRQPGDGTPLWALVDFADHLAPGEADRIEGALLVSGLLDALITPHGRPVRGDLVVIPDPSPGDRTLAAVLKPDHHPDVPTGEILRLLRSIPIDQPGASLGGGTVRTGVLTAACPDGYRASFIGRTARERARRQHVALLEKRLTARERDLSTAQAKLHAREEDVRAAAAERDALPPADTLTSARDHLADMERRLAATEQQAQQRTARADSDLQKVMAALDQRASERSARLARFQQNLTHAQQVAATADAAASEAEEAAAELREIAETSETACREAVRAQEEADEEHALFPRPALAALVSAHRAEDAAEEALDRAHTAVITAADQHRKATDQVRKALRVLNDAAALPDGSLLPTSHDALDRHARAVTALERLIADGASAARRCVDLMKLAHRDHGAAAASRTVAAREAEKAAEARRAATTALAEVRKLRELHGADYEELRQTRGRLSDQLDQAKSQAGTLMGERHEAELRANTAQVTLDNIEPQRKAAEQERDRCLRALGRLVDEGLAVVPDDIPTDASGRPAHLTAGLTWARRLLAGRTAHAERRTQLVQFRDRSLAALETSARDASAALARFNRQVVLVSVEETAWRRALIAEPDSARGEDLTAALESLRASIAQLEDDLRDDVKHAMRAGMFTRLRKDILVRRDAALQLVGQIRETLKDVRTGVAEVGIQVAWGVREQDEHAAEMIDLVTRAASEESFERMYDVLRRRMDEKAGEPWVERVAYAFDYRQWHEWRISVTHSSFGDSAHATFKEITTRSNPLESLSTGERRLATMLPLLAAAWSMYSGADYRGPRLLSIDEIDAAFDEPNLRQILALLRSWDFDVLATTPSITPMIKKEAGRAMVHQVVAAGRQRVTVPWLWEGHGEPRPLTIDHDLEPAS